VLTRFKRDVRGQAPLIGTGLFALLAEVVLRLLEPWPLKFILDRVIQPDPDAAATGIGWADALDPMTLLTVSAVAVVALTTLRAGASYASTVTFALAGNRILTDLRARLYRHLQRLDLGYHDAARGGDLITRLTGDIGRLQEVTVTAALPLVGNVITLVGMVGVMLWIDLPLTLVALAGFPLFCVTASRMTQKISTVARKQRKVEGDLASTAGESLGAIKVVQSYSLESTMEETFGAANRKSLKDGVKAKKLAAGLERRTDVLVAIGTGLVLFVGARQVIGGRMTPGDLIVFISYLKNAFKPMRDVAKYTGRLAKAAASGERVIDVLDTVPRITDRPEAAPAPRLDGRVRLESLWFAYDRDADGAQAGADRAVLRGLDLTVEPGQRVAVVGPSGAGKSSLASLLLRLYDPTGGRIVFDGRDLRAYTLDSVREQVAIVLQDSVLFAATVAENIAYGRGDASRADIEAAARLANADGFIRALPDGYDTVMSERGTTLSGGQRQRIAVARAALRDAPIVVLDEPTTGLDGANERDVIEALEHLVDGRTAFWITHDLTTVTASDRILWLEDGAVVEDGTHAELMAAGGRYATTYRFQERARASGTGTTEVAVVSVPDDGSAVVGRVDRRQAPQGPDERVPDEGGPDVAAG
jgi:ATP-binding cassette subfamily B protein